MIEAMIGECADISAALSGLDWEPTQQHRPPTPPQLTLLGLALGEIVAICAIWLVVRRSMLLGDIDRGKGEDVCSTLLPCVDALNLPTPPIPGAAKLVARVEALWNRIAFLQSLAGEQPP
jgi:hypothetical protein